MADWTPTGTNSPDPIAALAKIIRDLETRVAKLERGA